jgi:hypothetical protein
MSRAAVHATVPVNNRDYNIHSYGDFTTIR